MEENKAKCKRPFALRLLYSGLLKLRHISSPIKQWRGKHNLSMRFRKMDGKTILVYCVEDNEFPDLYLTIILITKVNWSARKDVGCTPEEWALCCG